MNVTCPECRSVFRIDPTKVPGGGTRARCAVCGGVMAVDVPVGFAEGRATPLASATVPMAPARVPSAPATASGAVWAPERPHAGVSAPPTARSTPAAPPPVSTPAWTPAPAPAGTPPAATPPAATPPATPPVTAAPAAITPPSTPTEPPPEVALPPAASLPQSAPRPAPRTSGGSGRPINPFLSNDPNQKARRLARALVSDMVAYHPQLREQALRDGTLKQSFRDEIKRSYEEYVEQVGTEFAESTGHFQEALNEILAAGRKVF